MKLLKGIHAISNVMAWISGLLVLAMAALTFVNVFARRVFSSPVLGAQEMCELAMSIILYFGLPFAVYSRRMIVVDAITHRLKKVPRETLAGICSILCMLMSSIYVWKLISTGLAMMTRHTGTDVLKIPFWPFYFACAFANFLLFVEQLLDGIRWISEARKPEPSSADGKEEI